uniref:Consortin, connexin sorting protein b n=1 Tax=Oreochromis niloticus TaxID=8128 RepID=A0A669D9C2_ORENI
MSLKSFSTATEGIQELVYRLCGTGNNPESVSRDESQGPTPQLLASLQSLGENSDYTLLPHSLHQIAEAYSLKQDYQWAIQFLQLEKLYHERLLSNLTVLQQSWGLPSYHLESEHSSPQTGPEEEDGDTCEEGQEVEEEEEEEEQCEETPEEEEVKVEWPTGVPQASDKDLAKLSHKEGVGLHFICLYTLFVGGDSCLILLLLCLVTVVISVGGTALYCTLLDTYSNICTDFTHNVDFYVMNVRRLVEGLGQLPTTSGCSRQLT